MEEAAFELPVLLTDEWPFGGALKRGSTGAKRYQSQMGTEGSNPASSSSESVSPVDSGAAGEKSRAVAARCA